MSLDGRIASPPDRRWITSEAARLDAMRLRTECEAILVGAETIRIDNPRLTLRGQRAARQPLRVVWSRSGKIPKASNVLTDIHHERTLIFSGKSLRTVLKKLGERGVQHVLIEGGGRTLGETFDKGLVDRVVFYIAPILMGGPVAAVGGLGAAGNETAMRLRDPVYKKIGPDLRIEGEITGRSGDR
jgi:diaminohydroxyphosphoribosylaminopyrimidine deaminase/5-amino-6-(5-phosphoribosylamino)uracil reductase